MSKDNNTGVAIKIMGKDYRIACKPEEEEALHKAARLVDNRMKSIRGNGKVIGAERVAVMAALNLAGELLASPEQHSDPASDSNKRIRGLRERIEMALNDSAQLEL